jgi:hypothetical protein
MFNAGTGELTIRIKLSRAPVQRAVRRGIDCFNVCFYRAMWSFAP